MKIRGNIINHNQSYNGEIEFSEVIENIKKLDGLCEDYIIPGFVDLHCHGGNGYEVMEGWGSITELSKYHLLHGTTSIAPTTWTETSDKTFAALKGYNEEIESYNNIIGIHLEGPFINPNKLGAQPPKTSKPNIKFLEDLMTIANIKIVTLAPELEGIEKIIKFLHQKKINIQFGHSLAEYNECINFMDDYHIGFTHLYNAMSGNDHRNPGVLAAALNKGKYAEIIYDKHHVSTPSFQIAKKSIPFLYTITDSIGVSGLIDGEYKFAGANIEKRSGMIKIKGKDTLAGSIVTMDKTFLNLLEANCTPQEAVSLTSYNASKYLSEDSFGEISVSKKANFLILDKNFNIKSVYLHGKEISQ
jgi:N-acetylglucosamine-6-phosphate deacetylase